MPSKYHNRYVVRDGVTYHSEKEFNRWCDLQALERSGIISDLKRQVPYELEVNRTKITTYVVDHVYKDQQGRLVIEDVKGYTKGTAYQLFKVKAALMLAIHGLRVIEV